MGDKSKGLLNKYNVSRTDGKELFSGYVVLEFKDPSAREGIKAFSKKVRSEGYEKLADDLDREVLIWEAKPKLNGTLTVDAVELGGC